MEWIKYTVRLHGAPCSSLDGVTACVVYTADSIRNSIQNRIGRPIRFEIRFERKKNDSQVPRFLVLCLFTTHTQQQRFTALFPGPPR